MKFSSDLKKALEGFTPDEQIHITEVLLTIAESHLKEPVDYDRIKTVFEEQLLKKYRNRLINFYNTGITDYFNQFSFKQLELQMQNDSDDSQEKKIIPEGNLLTEAERKEFLKSVIKLLGTQKEVLYLNSQSHENHAELKGIKTIEELKPEPSLPYKIQWTGKKDNRNEFVQLVYALHEAGYLNGGKGEITKITETLAEVLHVKLSSNWQSNLSKSIHVSNVDYEPAIFDTIKEAFKNYSDSLRENKREKK